MNQNQQGTIEEYAASERTETTERRVDDELKITIRQGTASR